jgi:hypothetical protein
MMPLPIEFILEGAEGALSLVVETERHDAARLLQVVRAHFIERQPDDGTRARTTGQLIEVLARRSARAMPFAALGRALVADLKGDAAQRDALLLEFQNKLSQLGL